MTEQAFCIETLRDELPRFVRVFEAFLALPQDTLTYKHPGDTKSKSALELLVTMAVEASTFPVFLSTGKIDFKEAYGAAPATATDALAMMKDSFEKTESVASSMSAEDWGSEAVMTGEGEWKTTKGKMLWALLLDLIHHRGQISTYLRPMGGKVPSIYGPSADSNE